MIDRTSSLYAERLGYYTVGPLKISDASQALLIASRMGVDPVWHFCDDVYGSIDWTKPIDMSLDSLYLTRLKQLRNSYDHLILYFSGGADSLNILNTAMDNNVHIDEIVMYYPFPLKNKFNDTDTSGDNNFSEIEFSAKPLLQKYQNRLTNTIIRYVDIAQANFDLLSNDNWIEQAPNHGMTVSSRTAAVSTDPRLIELAMQGKHVGLIFGIDKPRISYNRDTKAYLLHFLDVTMHPFSTPYHSESKQLLGEFIHYEPFYWTPFLPELVVKQAQVLVSLTSTDPLMKHFLQTLSTDKKFIRNREAIISRYLYRATDTLWQTDKPIGSLVRSLDSWFWDYATDTMKMNYKDAIAYMGKNCKSKYFVNNDILQGKVPHFSRGYIIKKDEGI